MFRCSTPSAPCSIRTSCVTRITSTLGWIATQNTVSTTAEVTPQGGPRKGSSILAVYGRRRTMTVVMKGGTTGNRESYPLPPTPPFDIQTPQDTKTSGTIPSTIHMPGGPGGNQEGDKRP